MSSTPINLDIYKEDEKVNALVNKYLNISTNPEDLIGNKYSTTSAPSTNYYTPSKVETYSYTPLDSSYSQFQMSDPIKTDYKVTNYHIDEENDLLKKYDNRNPVSSFGYDIGTKTYSEPAATLYQTGNYSSGNVGDYTNYSTSYTSEKYTSNYEQK